MRRLEFALILVSILGLSLYLWPALRAPVILRSDSQIDLDWARNGFGVLRPRSLAEPQGAGGHPLKPGYVLFLRFGLLLPFSSEPERRIIIFQSLLLLAAIGASAAYLAWRGRVAISLAVLAMLLVFLRLRDSCSAVMSEAPAAALLLPLAAFLLEPPLGALPAAVAGGLAGALILVRPNAGMPFALFLLVRYLLRRRRSAAIYSAAVAVVVLPVFLLTLRGANGNPFQGAARVMLFGSTDYYWAPLIGGLSTGPTERAATMEAVHRAAANWKHSLSQLDLDAARQIVWRAFHGILGGDYYEATWSPTYRVLDEAARIASPFLILAAIAALLTLPFGGEERVLNILALLLLGFLVLQNLVFGSLPRLVLPFLAALLLLGIAAFFQLLRQPRRRLVFSALFVGLTGLVAVNRHVLDWEWGRIERAGVTIRQPIPRGSLPASGPATLHVRIAEPYLPTAARIELLSPAGQILYDSARSADLSKPLVTVPLPEALLAESRDKPTFIEVRSSGLFDAAHFFLFPVIPPPWSASAQRAGSNDLSPSTGLRRGALDWWAHPGAD